MTKTVAFSALDGSASSPRGMMARALGGSALTSFDNNNDRNITPDVN